MTQTVPSVVDGHRRTPVPTPATPAVPEPGRSDVGRRFMMRIGGFPVDSVARLAASRLAVWAEELLDAEEHIEREQEVLGQVLHDRAGTLTGQDRSDVVWLRRQVAAGRSAYHGERAERALRLLDAATALRVHGFGLHRALLAGRMRDGASVAAQDADDARAQLRRLAADERLRAALLLASPDLEDVVDGWIGKVGAVDKRSRRIERSLLDYVYRMAWKPTPFTRFTGVALGEFASRDDGAADGGRVRVSASWLSYPRINVSLLTRIGALVVGHPVLRRDVGLSLTPGWHVRDNAVRFVRRSVRTGSTDRTVSFDAIDDSVFVLPSSAVLDRVLELFEAERVIVWDHLARELVLSEGGDQDEFDEYLAILVRLGLLRVPALAVDVHSADPLEAFYRSVSSLGPRIATLLLPGLGAMIDCVDQYPRADVVTRRRLLGEIRQSFVDLATRLDAPDEDVPRTVLFEDVRVDGDVIPWDENTWAEVARDGLETFATMLPAFDRILPHRIVLKGFFCARFGVGGRCDDVLKVINDFNEDLFDQYAQITARRRVFTPDGTFFPQINWLHQDELMDLDRARVAFASQLRRRYLASAADAEEITIDEKFVERVVGELPRSGREDPPLSHFVQLGVLRGEPVAVLNRTYGGVRFPFSRFTHCFDDLDGGSLSRQLREALSADDPDGPVYAEVTGGQATTNLNLHGRLVDREIVCPGEWSSAPPRRQVTLDALYVEHDPVVDRLVLREKKTGREIVPAYLGYLVPSALSDVPRTLMLFSQSSIISFDPWSGVPERDDAAVTARPRLRLGRLVVARRSWTARADALPRRSKNQPEAEWFLGWRRWRREHRVPTQAFVRVHKPDDRDADVGHYALARTAKPQYLDFDSPFALTVLEQRLDDDACVVLFEEVLPDCDGLHVESAEGQHVSELVVETVVPAQRGTDAAR